MMHGFSALARTLGAFAAASTAALVIAGCGSDRLGDHTVVDPWPSPTATGNHGSTQFASPAAMAKALNGKGIDCSGFALAHSSDIDLGATAEGHCGSAAIIELATLSGPSAIQPFVANLHNFTNCDSSTTIHVYIDGGTWAIYSTDDATTTQIATALGTSTSQVC